MIVKKSRKKLQNSDSEEKSSIIADRLRLAIHALGYRKISDFIKYADVNKSSVYAILNGQTRDPGAGILLKFYYAGINLNWLISGEGNILREGFGPAAEDEAGIRIPKVYPTLKEPAPIERKIRDAMNDIMGLYQQLKEMHFYAAEVEKLPPEKQEMFHRMLRALIKSLQGKGE